MYRLHCIAQSGNCFKVAFMLRALGVPYESHYVDYLKGTTREPTWRESVNELGEIPVLEDGDRTLTQSGAILTYLAAKHGRFGGDDDDQRLEVLRWLLYDITSSRATSAPTASRRRSRRRRPCPK